MKLSEKIRAIRMAEGLSQNQLSQLIDLSRNTLAKYESGLYEPSGSSLMKLTQHPRFEKYTLWLMTDKTAPAAGQIAPALAHIGPDATQSNHSDKQTG
ncbi:helix-turn-helix transcriptional regulator [Brenneria populi]|uniref:Helix-turn-helix transcriptional regulator n=1 Tax=Brenneria populi TaxID=1505588 RepID=A0ABU6JSZ1_9GAMM|nr:helix-turn-helix transcriptional regulator [Brenneria populi Li et al. 2015]